MAKLQTKNLNAVNEHEVVSILPIEIAVHTEEVKNYTGMVKEKFLFEKVEIQQTKTNILLHVVDVVG
nr:hypothetical protein [Mycoplasmopsis bovis]QQH18757.1 hypothetical protein HYE49_00950 [Mycoplasmopsis bovis]